MLVNRYHNRNFDKFFCEILNAHSQCRKNGHDIIDTRETNTKNRAIPFLLALNLKFN